MPSPEPTPTPEALVIVESLNLRSGPGTVYDPPIGVLHKGDILDVLGRIISNDWIQVLPANPDVVGWVRATPDLVQINVDLNTIPTIQPPPTPTATPWPTPTIPIITVAPTLVNPQPGASQFRNRIDLEWDWPGTLGPNDYFQVEIRNRFNAHLNVIDEFVSPIDVAWVKVKFYRYDRIEEAYDREFTWRIIVVRGIPPKEKQWSTPEYQVWEPGPSEQVSQPSEMRTLYVEETDGPPPPDPDPDTDPGDLDD